MKINQIVDVLISRSMKQGLAAEIYDLSKESYPSGKVTKENRSREERHQTGGRQEDRQTHQRQRPEGTGGHHG